MRSRIVSSALVVLSILGGLVITAAPANAAPSIALAYDGTDPNATGCASGSTVAASAWITNSSGQYLALVKLKWSPTCGTNWGTITKSTYGKSLLIWTYRNSPYYASGQYGGGGSQYYADQAYGDGYTVCAMGRASDASGRYYSAQACA